MSYGLKTWNTRHNPRPSPDCPNKMCVFANTAQQRPLLCGSHIQCFRATRVLAQTCLMELRTYFKMPSISPSPHKVGHFGKCAFQARFCKLLSQGNDGKNSNPAQVQPISNVMLNSETHCQPLTRGARKLTENVACSTMQSHIVSPSNPSLGTEIPHGIADIFQNGFHQPLPP